MGPFGQVSETRLKERASRPSGIMDHLMQQQPSLSGRGLWFIGSFTYTLHPTPSGHDDPRSEYGPSRPRRTPVKGLVVPPRDTRVSCPVPVAPPSRKNHALPP